MVRKDPKWLRRWKKQESKARLNWEPYVIRDKVLKDIGFITYTDYLASSLWQEIRSKIMLPGIICSCCNELAGVLHHGAYYKKLLLGDEASIKQDLYPLCYSCHYKIEFEDKRKRSWGEAIRVFRRMLYRFKHGMSKSQMIREQIQLARKAKKESEV